MACQTSIDVFKKIIVSVNNFISFILKAMIALILI